MLGQLLPVSRRRELAPDGTMVEQAASEGRLYLHPKPKLCQQRSGQFATTESLVGDILQLQLQAGAFDLSQSKLQAALQACIGRPVTVFALDPPWQLPVAQFTQQPWGKTLLQVTAVPLGGVGHHQGQPRIRKANGEVAGRPETDERVIVQQIGW